MLQMQAQAKAGVGRMIRLMSFSRKRSVHHNLANRSLRGTEALMPALPRSARP